MSVTIHQGNCLKVIKDLGEFDMIFADPFDNIGLKYNGFNDRISNMGYTVFLEQVIQQMWRWAPISWMSFNAIHLSKVGYFVDSFVPNNDPYEAPRIRTLYCIV